MAISITGKLRKNVRTVQKSQKTAPFKNRGKDLPRQMVKVTKTIGCTGHWSKKVPPEMVIIFPGIRGYASASSIRKEEHKTV